MQKKRSIKIISIVLILVLICISITYVKSGNKVVLATTKEFNTENLQNNEHMHIEVDSSGDKVPVPNGYVGSKVAGENEIDTGYVIYEGEEEVNDSNVEEAQKTRNQYVWIPVPDASTMYGTDANGKKWGKLYNFATSSNNVNFDEVTGTYPLNWSEKSEIYSVTKTGYREPDVVLKSGDTVVYDEDSIIKQLFQEENSAHRLLIQVEKEFNNMITSIEKYGGFYIGRYETGNLSRDNYVIKKFNYDIAGQTWYKMYLNCKKIKDNNENIETGMIWGCQYDRTLMWLIETGNKTKEQVSEDSTSWGNYINATFEYINQEGIITEKVKSTLIPTGSTDYTKANNIYDLVGNVSDWTAEATFSGSRVSRGGAHNSDGIQYKAGNHYSITPTSKSNARGCRAMLYIK